MTEIGLVGPGVLGRTLALSLPADTYRLGGVLSHSKVSSRRAVREMKRGSVASGWSDLEEAHVIVASPPQESLADVLHEAVGRLERPTQSRILVTGIPTPDVRRAIADLENRGAQIGGLLPIAFYRRPGLVVRGGSFALWGAPAAVRGGRRLVTALGCKHSVIDRSCAGEALLAVAMVSGVLTASLELGVRRLMHAGFTRHRAIEALAPLAEASLAEHRRSRIQPPPAELPAGCPDLIEASSRSGPHEDEMCRSALRLASERLP